MKSPAAKIHGRIVFFTVTKSAGFDCILELMVRLKTGDVTSAFESFFIRNGNSPVLINKINGSPTNHARGRRWVKRILKEKTAITDVKFYQFKTYCRTNINCLKKQLPCRTHERGLDLPHTRVFLHCPNSHLNMLKSPRQTEVFRLSANIFRFYAGPSCATRLIAMSNDPQFTGTFYSTADWMS